MKKIIATLSVLSFSGIVFADGIGDLVGGVNGMVALAGGLGVGLLGLFGIVRQMREALQAVTELALYIKSQANEPELKTKADKALEECADVLERVPWTKKYAKILRDAL